jgi:hypothetical protein
MIMVRLETAKEYSSDVAFMDINMPKFDRIGSRGALDYINKFW